MSYQLIDNNRGKVLQEFDTKKLAEMALERQSSEANVSIVEKTTQRTKLPKKTTSGSPRSSKKRRVTNGKKEGD